MRECPVRAPTSLQRLITSRGTKHVHLSLAQTVYHTCTVYTRTYSGSSARTQGIEDTWKRGGKFSYLCLTEFLKEEEA